LARSASTPPSSIACGEQIGEQRQRAGVLGRFLRRPPGDVGREAVGLEARREERGRPAHDLAQLALTQRRHVDLAVHGIERLVVLQCAQEVGAQAHQHHQARVAELLREQLGEAAALAFVGADIELLALVDIEEERRRLGLMELFVTALGGIEQVA
jgi:hypothetical protein